MYPNTPTNEFCLKKTNFGFDLSKWIVEGLFLATFITTAIFCIHKANQHFKKVTRYIIYFNILNSSLNYLSQLSQGFVNHEVFRKRTEGTILWEDSSRFFGFLWFTSLWFSNINFIYLVRFKRVQLQLRSIVEKTSHIMTQITISIRVQHFFMASLLILFIFSQLIFFL